MSTPMMFPGEHKVKLCPHARDRMDEMGLARYEVMDVLHNPELDYDAKDGRRMAVRGEVAVLYQPIDRVVITVLWHQPDTYKRCSKSS